MIKCQRCERKTQLFLCTTCTAELRTMLTDLPQWVEWLADTALGRTRGGRGARRGRSYESPLPFTPDTEYGRRSRQDRASHLLAAINNGLGTIVRDLCETRGVKWRPVQVISPKFIGPLRRNQIRGERTGPYADPAWWLAHHVATIAADESAGHVFEEVQRYREEIDRIINPHIPMRWIGPCPTWTDPNKQCGKELRAKADAVEVTCRKCHRTHNVSRLQLLMVNELEHKKLTIEEILRLGNRYLPEEYRISKQTLHRWRKHDLLKPRGWKRADGRIGITKHEDDDVPLYVWADIRKLRAELQAKKTAAMRWATPG